MLDAHLAVGRWVGRDLARSAIDQTTRARVRGCGLVVGLAESIDATFRSRNWDALAGETAKFVVGRHEVGHQEANFDQR